MDLSKYINYINTEKKSSPELEIRFGSYSRVSSNISQRVFNQIYKLGKSHTKKYIYKKELLISHQIKKVFLFADLTGEIKKIFDGLGDSKGAKDDTVGKLTALTNQKPISSHYMSKEKIFRHISGTNYKISLVNETISEKPLNQEKPNPNERHKFRCSWKEDMWIFDLTIMLFCKDGDCVINFEVELEYNNKVGKKYTISQIQDSAHDNIKKITSIIDCYTNTSTLKSNIKNGMHNGVVTLERKSLHFLQKALYSLCDKADGERRFIYINSRGSAFYINPNNATMKCHAIPSKKKSRVCNVLVDCEYIVKNEHGTKHTYYGFDAMFYNGVDYRNHNLPVRLELMKKAFVCLSAMGTEFLYKPKKFYMVDIFNNAKKIWNSRKTLFPYELDGLIFTPVRGSYNGHLPILKWKYLHSIDVRVMYNKQNNYTEFYANGRPVVKTIKNRNVIINEYKSNQTGKVYYKSRINNHDARYKKWQLVNKNGVLGTRGKLDMPNFRNMDDIVEVEFVPNERRWKFLRTRPDKENPNSYLSIKSVMEAVVDNITIDVIGGLKYTPSEYEMIGRKHNKCFSDVGFNFIIPDVRNVYTPIHRYYTHVYAQFIRGKSVLLLGADKCILDAVLRSPCEEICVVERNCLELYGRTESEGYQGLIEYAKNSSKKINFVWGDDIKKISKKYDMVWINSFESLLTTEKKYMATMSKIKTMSKRIVGMCLNGSQVAKDMNKCVVLKDSNMSPLYKLYYKGVKPCKDPNIFKCATQFVEIQRVRNNFHAEKQLFVYKENVAYAAKLAKLKIKSWKSMKFPISQWNGLDEYDKAIASMTAIFELA